MKGIILWSCIVLLSIFVFIYDGGFSACDDVTSCALLLLLVASVYGLISEIKALRK